MILVVDDYADSAIALSRLLQQSGFPSEWTSGGAEALARIRTHPPEQPLLVILDEAMPHMSGLEVLAQIRSDPRIAHTNVIMYTAGFDAKKRDEAMVLGAAAWLLKGGGRDMGLDQILETVKHWYERVGGVRSERVR